MTRTKLPEDLPRYVIDADVPQAQKETKILSEEQEKVLNKLLKVSSHVLGEEERDLMYRLLDKLHQETERVRSLKKMVVHDKPLDSFLSEVAKKNNHRLPKPESSISDMDKDFDETPETESPKVQTIRRVVGFSPDEVVKRYIECWNQQKFGAEFDCFSSEFMKIDREAYVQARQTSYLQMLTRGGMRVDFGEIITNTMAGGDAEVIATKITQEPNRKPKEDKDLYRLRIERGRWVIYRVENMD